MKRNVTLHALSALAFVTMLAGCGSGTSATGRNERGDANAQGISE